MADTSSTLSKAGSGAATGAMVGGPYGAVIGGGIGLLSGLLDNSDAQAQQQLQQDQQLYGNLQTPTFNPYNPQTYTAGNAQAQTVQQDPNLRAQQMQAIMQMGGLANTGLSAVDNAGFEQARDVGNQMMNSGNAAALQNAQARGVGGSGLEFAMHDQANAAAAGQANQAGLQQAADSARQRALYNQAYGNALSGMQQQQTGLSAANANILNNFSQYNTNNQNQANLYNTGQQNYAQQYNNQMAQQTYQDQYQKAAGQAGAGQQIANGDYAQGAANQSNFNSAVGAASKYGIAKMNQDQTE